MRNESSRRSSLLACRPPSARLRECAAPLTLTAASGLRYAGASQPSSSRGAEAAATAAAA
eukprot:CAMPEP_0196707386 /NCGR_PEP_ID=MMETSP1090-20130531/63934_1 /TAXON_ID=37098 /ORGANISM="Isochrysis sp, Strain CCMP1244" /LENGTH=59 /DNA_ID=CAMNT_0042047357 /DNA_START=106 /DNA_END=282 /DNA_ORIENTATION=+